MKSFDEEVTERISANAHNVALQRSNAKLMEESLKAQYSYNFAWLGRPIIQYPQDIVAMQQLIWSVQPDLIIETGIAHGGSVIFSASMLELNAACGGPAAATVVAIDIDIRAHNRAAIEAHPMFKRVSLIQGSSVSPDIVAEVKARTVGKERVMVCLDSNHTHEHVLAELTAYAPLVTIGSYCIVFDTIVEDMPAEIIKDRPWSPGNNPKTAVREYLTAHSEFEIDSRIDNTFLLSVAPSGYLKRVK